MGKLSRKSARESAIVMSRYQHMSGVEIAKKLGVSQNFVSRWKKADLSHMEDKPRSGRPRCIPVNKERIFKRQVERGGVGNMNRIAGHFGCSRRTVLKTIKRLGGKVVPTKAVIQLKQKDYEKRLSFAKEHLNDDFTTWCWFDDKSLEIPPDPPHRHISPQYRFADSSSPPKEYPRVKSKVKLMMFVGVSYNGKSKPVFNVEHSVGVKGGHKTTIQHVTTETTILRLRNTIIPFMKKNNIKVVAMDNSPVQANKKVLAEFRSCGNITSVGFQSDKLKAELRDPGGIPPNSPDTSVLDAGVFGYFETRYRLACPKNIDEAIRAAKKIWREIPQTLVQSYVNTYGNRLREIIKAKGGPTNWQRRSCPHNKSRVQK